jgi:DNA-binding GntR family transcriptional regulator
LAKGAHSKADAVYFELKEAILAGALEPGSLIDKAALCEKLGVSRFPVSAAVSRLAYDRLVDVVPQHGSFVARISLNDTRERLFIRGALEGEIAAEAARRMPDQGRVALAANMKEASAAAETGDRQGFYMLDVAFHHILTAGLGMTRAADILDGLRDHLERARRLLMSPPGRLREIVREHGAVIEAVETGDATAARAAMKRHIERTEVLLETVASERPGLFSP